MCSALACCCNRCEGLMAGRGRRTFLAVECSNKGCAQLHILCR
jgi:hypothetical protein